MEFLGQNSLLSLQIRVMENENIKAVLDFYHIYLLSLIFIHVEVKLLNNSEALHSVRILYEFLFWLQQHLKGTNVRLRLLACLEIAKHPYLQLIMS